MLLFPNCKINLGLNIIRKRENGYHDLETVFYPVGLKDALEAIKPGVNSLVPSTRDGVEFTSSGLHVAGDIHNNLCVKAWHLLKKDFPLLPGIQMHLHKIIPMGAGLGGGSSDGAFALMLIDQLCGLNLSQYQLISYALQLGSDCPFFIINKPCFATGRGENMQPLELDLSSYHFVIVNPNIHVSTAQAFSQITPGRPAQNIYDIIQLHIQEWEGQLVNDFEKVVSSIHPEIAAVKQELYKQGAVYASMTGSGSSVFGIFDEHITPAFSLAPSWQVYKIK